ncbi:response regulator [Mesorhizobium newzealandense]|uniref:Response regulator n=1 Tax=Mesorhizobium newzealandense TaxID=1300302 RepID=A0ABW4UJ96_9HYPH
MKLSSQLVAVVDDDESVRESLPDLLKELGFSAVVFTSAEEILASNIVQNTRCFILDVTMPGMTGPDLQVQLARRGVSTPIIYITAQKDEALRSRLIAKGAVACLFKPFSDAALQDALRLAIGWP